MRKEVVEIKRLGINGEGIGYINKKICFIKGALPEETVEVEIEKEEKNYRIGKLLKVIKPSKQRKKPECYLQLHCLNCPLMILEDEGIKYFKKDIIRDSLRKYTTVPFAKVEMHNPILAKAKEGYQNMASIPVVHFNDRITFGIYQRESKYLTLMKECQLLHPLIRETLVELEELFNELNVEVYNDRTNKGLRFISLRVLNNQLMVLLVTGHNGLDQTIIDRVSALPQIASLYFTINTTRKQDFKDGRFVKLYGEDKLPVDFNGHTYYVGPKTEFPMNLESAKTLVDETVKLIDKDTKNILEISCESGWLTAALSNYNVKAIDSKMFNTKVLNDLITKEEFNTIDVEQGNTVHLTQALTKANRYDTIIVHETHLGMHEQMKKSLLLTKAKQVLYISNNPSSFAKDMKDFEANYLLKAIVPVDFDSYNESVTFVAKLELKNDKKRR